VRELLDQLHPSNIDIDGSDDECEESIKRVFDAYEALQSGIGYGQLCTDCLYEKTGLDLLRPPLSTHS
jgi:hypothetical protein